MEAPLIMLIYFKKHPILKEIWNKCNEEEKNKLHEAFTIISSKKWEVNEEKRNKSCKWALRREYEKLHPEIKKEKYFIVEKEEILKQEYNISDNE